jgi:hypothetical protein
MEWSDEETKILVDGWTEGLTIPQIEQKLPKRTYSQITMKAWRIGLPSRKKTLRYKQRDETEDLLELTPDHPSWNFLDHSYTDDEVKAIYAPAPKPKLRTAYCSNNCGTLCSFETPYQRWCDPCRKQMNQIFDNE